MAISADSGHSTALYRYHGSITARAHLLEKVGSRCKHTKRDALFLVKQDEQQAGQAQQEGIEQQGDDVKGADGVAEGCAGGNGHQHLGAVGDDALKDAGEGVQQGSGALGADAVSCQHSAGNQVHPLNSSLVFFLSYHAPQKATPSSPRGPISFLADSEEEQHNYQNAGEGAITFSRNVCGLKRTRYKAFHEPLFRCGRRTFCVCSVNFQKNG